MKNLLIKLLPLLAIVIAAPAFAGTNDEYHDRSNQHASYGENHDRQNRNVSHGENRDRQNRSHFNHRREYVKVVTRQNYSSRDRHHEARGYHEARGHHQARGHHDNYFHR